MLMIFHLAAFAFALIPTWASELLDVIKSPVITPLVVSLFTWVLNEYTNLLKKIPNALKDTLIVLVPLLLTFVAQKMGVDVSSIGAAAGGLVSIIIFKLGQAKERSKLE